MPSSHAPASPSGTPATASEPIDVDVEISDGELLMALTGPGSTRLTLLEKGCGVDAGQRGHTIHLHGQSARVELAQRVLMELMDVVQAGASLNDGEVAGAIRLVRDHPDVKLRALFQDVVLTFESGRQLTPRGMAQKLYLSAIRDNDIVFGVGPAGTGKTYLAMAMAVAALRSRRVKRIILTRPAVEAGEKLGFLPGDLTEKVDPYLRPLYDALYDMMHAEKVHSLIQRGTIEVAPLAFMRGRTLNDSFVVLDEAQNTTVAQMKMFLTRVGMRSKAVITGDVTQVDLPGGTGSGLRDALGLFDRIDGLSCCYFSSEDVVRHPLVQRIVEAYDARDERRLKEKESKRGRSDGS